MPLPSAPSQPRDSSAAGSTTRVPTNWPVTMLIGPMWNAPVPSTASTLRTSAPNTISARFSSAVETPTVAKIWVCGSADSRGWISAPTANNSKATGIAAAYGCRPACTASSQTT